MKTPRILVVDDEKNIRLSVKSCLVPEGYNVDEADTADSAIGQLRENIFDIAIIDIRLGEQSGIALFEKVQEEKIAVPVIFISGNASLAEAAQSLKLGAYDFIEKPFNADKLLVTVKNCLQFHQMKNRVQDLESSQQQGLLLGDHKLMQALRNSIAKVAPNDVAVLINGESGTGKELIAQSIHQQSKRAEQRLVSVNCSAIPENLIESTLFGHVKGAFTGADQHKKGYFEMAHGGSIFLDEIGDMPLPAQASLLRVLENREIQKVGSEKVTKVDVRILAASHKNLKDLIEKGLFREDLYYRLNVVPISSPALRDRSSDIPLLVNHFVDKLSQKNGFVPKSIAPECFAILSNYHWPGNVRELLNTVERMLIMGDERLTKADIPEEISGLSTQPPVIEDDISLREFRNRMERDLIIKKLKQFAGNITQVAKALEVDRSYLHKKISQLDIKRSQDFD